MFGDVDLTGWGALIAATCTGIASVVAAVFAGVAALRSSRNGAAIGEVHAAVATNGDSRTIGEIASDVASAVAPDPNQGRRAGDDGH